MSKNQMSDTQREKILELLEQMKTDIENSNRDNLNGIREDAERQTKDLLNLLKPAVTYEITVRATYVTRITVEPGEDLEDLLDSMELPEDGDFTLEGSDSEILNKEKVDE